MTLSTAVLLFMIVLKGSAAVFLLTQCNAGRLHSQNIDEVIIGFSMNNVMKTQEPFEEDRSGGHRGYGQRM